MPLALVEEGPELTTGYWQRVAPSAGAVEWLTGVSTVAGDDFLAAGRQQAHLVDRFQLSERIPFPRGQKAASDFAAISARGINSSVLRSRMLDFARRWGYLRQPLPVMKTEGDSATMVGFGEPASVWLAESSAVASIRQTIEAIGRLRRYGEESSRRWLQGRLMYVTEERPNPDSVLRFGGLPPFFGYDPVDNEDVQVEAAAPPRSKFGYWPSHTSWPPPAPEAETSAVDRMDPQWTAIPGPYRIVRTYEGDGRTLIPVFEPLPVAATEPLAQAAHRAVRRYLEIRLRRAMSPVFPGSGHAGIRYYPRDMISAIYLQLLFEVAGVDTAKTRRCEQCRQPYQYQRTGKALFCSDRCKKAAYRARCRSATFGARGSV